MAPNSKQWEELVSAISAENPTPFNFCKYETCGTELPSRWGEKFRRRFVDACPHLRDHDT